MNPRIRTLARKILPANARAYVGRILRRPQLDRSIVANSYLKGNGIEIGALHTPLEVPSSVSVKYVDRMRVEDLRVQYPELADYNLVVPDIIADGERLETVDDTSLDFVIANHFIEHCQNPILAIRNMIRVLKPDGILYLAIPDKRFTFDVDRPVTELDHLVQDFNNGPSWSQRQHFEEWARLVEKVPEEDVNRHATALMSNDHSIHFHVWTQKEMFEFVLFLRETLSVSFDIELSLKNQNECIFVLRKI